jgi:hypothetical protein
MYSNQPVPYAGIAPAQVPRNSASICIMTADQGISFGVCACHYRYVGDISLFFIGYKISRQQLVRSFINLLIASVSN